MKHRIGLTVTDPNHPMVSKRKETIQKTVRVSGEDREKAINGAIAHYKRKGYKVHDHHYIGTVNEEAKIVHSRTGANGTKYHIRQDSANDYSVHREVDGKLKHIDTYGSLQRAKSVLDNEVKEDIDKEHPIAKEYQALKKHDIKTLRNMIKGQQKIVDVSGYSSKDHAISAYLRHKHGDKNVAAAMGLKEADAFPVGHDGQQVKSQLKSTRQSAETRARSTAAQAVNKSKTDAAMKEDIEQQDEAWAQGNRNPQRGIKVGHKVRSYDFPGMHDDHYVEGHVVGETPHSYHIRVNRVVRSGKEIPTPAHMSHVEAPKGKGMFSNAYAVHKMIAKQTEVQAAPEPAKGGARTFASVRGKK